MPSDVKSEESKDQKKVVRKPNNTYEHSVKDSQELKDLLVELLQKNKKFAENTDFHVELEDVPYQWPRDKMKEGTEQKCLLNAKVESKSKEGKTVEERFYLNFSDEGEYPLEAYCYETLVPRIGEHQNKKKLKPHNKLNMPPPFYGKFSFDSHDVAVIGPEQHPFRFLHTQCDEWDGMLLLLVEELAKLHAISLSMQRENPERFEKLVKPLNEEYDKYIEGRNMKKHFRNTAEHIKKYLKVPQYSDEFFDIFLKRINDSLIPLLDRNFHEFKVLTHGDIFVNKLLLFERLPDHRVVMSAIIADWKRPYVTSPLIDLSYALFCGLFLSRWQLYGERIFLVWDTYLEKLKEVLKDLGLKESDYPLEHMRDYFIRFGRLGLVQSYKLFEDRLNLNALGYYGESDDYDAKRISGMGEALIEYRFLEVDFKQAEIDQFFPIFEKKDMPEATKKGKSTE